MNSVTINDILTLNKKYSTPHTLNHQIRVCNFALTLFNYLIKNNELDDDDKTILICASLLHDIGKYIDKDLHHKYSMSIILNDINFENCLKELRDPISIVVYSHRKVIWNDIYFLKEPVKTSLLMIISILRIADGLDCYKKDDLKIINIHSTSQYLTLTLNSRYSNGMNKVLNHKKTLFQQVFNKELIIKYNSK